MFRKIKIFNFYFKIISEYIGYCKMYINLIPSLLSLYQKKNAHTEELIHTNTNIL